MYIFINHLEEKRISNADEEQANGIKIALNKKHFLLEVESNDTIRKVKSRIQIKEGLPIEQSILVFKREQLDDNARLFNYKITSESTVQLHLRSIKIFYINLNEEKKCLSVESTDTIQNIKIRIERKEAICKESFYLTFNKFALESNRTLIYYGIHKFLTLHLNDLKLDVSDIDL